MKTDNDCPTIGNSLHIYNVTVNPLAQVTNEVVMEKLEVICHDTEVGPITGNLLLMSRVVHFVTNMNGQFQVIILILTQTDDVFNVTGVNSEMDDPDDLVVCPGEEVDCDQHLLAQNIDLQSHYLLWWAVCNALLFSNGGSF